MYEVTFIHLGSRQAGAQISLAARNMGNAVNHVNEGLKFIKCFINQSYVAKYIGTRKSLQYLLVDVILSSQSDNLLVKSNA